MRTSMILSLVLSAALPLTAQAPSTTGHSQYVLPHTNLACPVRLNAERRSATGMILRETDGRARPHGQGLQVNFDRAQQLPIIAADLTVHGYSGGAIALPLTVTSAKDLVQDFHLTGTSERPIVESSIWTSNMTAISWIEVTRLVYADGTTWQRSSSRECVFEPSLYVPVNAK